MVASVTNIHVSLVHGLIHLQSYKWLVQSLLCSITLTLTFCPRNSWRWSEDQAQSCLIPYPSVQQASGAEWLIGPGDPQDIMFLHMTRPQVPTPETTGQRPPGKCVLGMVKCGLLAKEACSGGSLKGLDHEDESCHLREKNTFPIIQDNHPISRFLF